MLHRIHLDTNIKPKTTCTVTTKRFCFTGSEIISCFETGTSDDVCQLCKAGKVQPDYISSHAPDKNCFKRMSSCLAAGE
jgi:hypothetical protein